MSEKFYVYCHKCERLIAICYCLDLANLVSTMYFKRTGHPHTLGTKEYFAKSYPNIVLEPEKIILALNGGVASMVEKPDAIEVYVHDYDVEGDWDVEDDMCFTDDEGDRYQKLHFPATEIKFSANGKQCFTDVEIKKSIGWQPAPSEFPLAGLHTFEVYEDLEMGKGCHTEVKNWIEIFKGMIEKPVIIPAENEKVVVELNPIEESALKNITILQHNISYYLDENELLTIEVGDCEYEHILYSITQGIIEGELCKTDPKDDEKIISGWWKIVK